MQSKTFFVLIKALCDVQQKVHVAARERQLEVTKRAKNDIAVLLTALGVDFSCQSHFRFDKQSQQSGRFIKFFATERHALIFERQPRLHVRAFVFCMLIVVLV
jgi:hypothetical protein